MNKILVRFLYLQLLIKTMKKEVYLFIFILIFFIFIYLLISKDSCGNDVRCNFFKAQLEKDPKYCDNLDDASKENCLNFVKIGALQGGNNIINKNTNLNYLKYSLIIISIISFFILTYLTIIHLKLFIKKDNKNNPSSMNKKMGWNNK